ncbi:MAG TPA: ribonuclease H-like domain-containing protein [Oligoflexus sp.]|uniref:ribonuclease H-like domain-containing protein n=1 Tax=Oligoflexus sp. TaxID=1971216 RepID=UPI002D5F41ED|nr:ribonuclease H-like domain-containing protein [Oligoflexus sp.]HYX34202.1 ribonuclease H-like domain-containing protein [Oligoflexus sp.]
MTSHSILNHQLLRRTFVHLKGVGPRSERHLWKIGITDWEQLLNRASQLFKAKRLDDIYQSLERSMAAWERQDLYYFDRALPGNERWRLVPGGFHDIAYFDIEAANGGMPPATESTAIAFLFRGELYQEYEYSRKRDLLHWIMDEAALFCTYNGAAYDVPFLSAEFGMPLDKAHIDLCPWLRRQGFKGGLKAIQKATTHLHQRSSMDLDGYDAVRLWRMHEEALPGALETLLTYNAEDVLILEPLLVEAYNREVENHLELNLEKMQSIPVPALKTRMDPHIYQLLRTRETVPTA